MERHPVVRDQARASARFASDPVERSSTTSTSWPSASRRSTSVEPMNPAPPVTRTRTVSPLGRRHGHLALRQGWRRRATCAASADDRRRRATSAPAPIARVGPDDRRADPCTGIEARAREQHRAAPRRHRRQRRSPRRRSTPRCVRVDAIDALRADEHRRVEDRRRRRRSSSRPRRRARARCAPGDGGSPTRPASTSACACQVLLRRADVDPVVVGTERDTVPVVRRASRESLTLDRHRLAFRDRARARTARARRSPR